MKGQTHTDKTISSKRKLFEKLTDLQRQTMTDNGAKPISGEQII